MLADLWALDPAIDFLNHGAFGACPRPILAEQSRLRAQMEAEPARFMVRELEGLLDEARQALGTFLGADPDDLVFVPNATTGVATVLAALDFAPGDEILTTDHVYAAVRNALKRSGATVVVVSVSLPVVEPGEVLEAVLAGVTPRTRLAVLDHITSPSALVFPIAELVAALAERGIETLVDGAHAAGQVPVALDALGAAYYTGNCHKWLCAPKGSGFLHVRRDRQAGLRPVITSNGASSSRRDRSPLRLEFDWVGTADPTPYLCVPAALALPEAHGGWPAWQAANHELALKARAVLLALPGVTPLGGEALVGAMASVALPDARGPGPLPPFLLDPLQDWLFHAHQIETIIFNWPRWPARVLRISAQRYNSLAQYERLAALLPGAPADHL
jgi:isopenicillin-N epimerase